MHIYASCVYARRYKHVPDGGIKWGKKKRWTGAASWHCRSEAFCAVPGRVCVSVLSTKLLCSNCKCLSVYKACAIPRVSVYKSLCCTCTYDGPSIKGCCAAPGRPVLHLYPCLSAKALSCTRWTCLPTRAQPMLYCTCRRAFYNFFVCFGLLRNKYSMFVLVVSIHFLKMETNRNKPKKIWVSWNKAKNNRNRLNFCCFQFKPKIFMAYSWFMAPDRIHDLWS